MIKPLEEKQKDKFLFLKIYFLIFLFAGSILADNYFNQRKKQGEVLSAKVQKKESININQIVDKTKSNLNDLQKNTQDLIGQVLGATEEKVNQIASQSSKIVSDFVFDNTLGNLLKQIDKLPHNEKEKIKEYLCK
ncbi:MAG: hypothetical protein ACPLRN_02830 [Microgenomates group bacterium]